jgi:hypothetical protein
MILTGDTFLGIGNTAWTACAAIASWAYDILTLALVVFAATQIWLARREARVNRTLSACDRYDFDPILDAACRNVAAAQDSGDLEANPQKYRVDMYSILNYLETVATGVERGLYDAKIVRSFMEHIMISHFDQCLTSGLVARAAAASGVSTGSSELYYDALKGLIKGWSKPLPWYRRMFRRGR